LDYAGVLEFFGIRTGLAQRKRTHAGANRSPALRTKDQDIRQGAGPDEKRGGATGNRPEQGRKSATEILRAPSEPIMHDEIGYDRTAPRPPHRSIIDSAECDTCTRSAMAGIRPAQDPMIMPNSVNSRGRENDWDCNSNLQKNDWM
jgi:hypothetical protein